MFLISRKKWFTSNAGGIETKTVNEQEVSTDDGSPLLLTKLKLSLKYYS